ncbi:hypothetical protein L596_011170 [Steinernema carpocapsae]|uniref:Uncharacterized protein n=2 Tax=Steinernema carpocapsae TaxID=34508 RepID=A0A4U5NTJ8_STECR|nr:hypothetical protein L596_011170 [Steinernema carpocapsae]
MNRSVVYATIETPRTCTPRKKVQSEPRPSGYYGFFDSDSESEPSLADQMRTLNIKRIHEFNSVEFNRSLKLTKQAKDLDKFNIELKDAQLVSSAEARQRFEESVRKYYRWRSYEKKKSQEEQKKLDELLRAAANVPMDTGLKDYESPERYTSLEAYLEYLNAVHESSFTIVEHSMLMDDGLCFEEKENDIEIDNILLKACSPEVKPKQTTASVLTSTLTPISFTSKPAQPKTAFSSFNANNPKSSLFSTHSPVPIKPELCPTASTSMGSSSLFNTVTSNTGTSRFGKAGVTTTPVLPFLDLTNPFLPFQRSSQLDLGDRDNKNAANDTEIRLFVFKAPRSPELKNVGTACDAFDNNQPIDKPKPSVPVPAQSSAGRRIILFSDPASKFKSFEVELKKKITDFAEVMQVKLLSAAKRWLREKITVTMQHSSVAKKIANCVVTFTEAFESGYLDDFDEAIDLSSDPNFDLEKFQLWLQYHVISVYMTQLNEDSALYEAVLNSLAMLVKEWPQAVDIISTKLFELSFILRSNYEGLESLIASGRKSGREIIFCEAAYIRLFLQIQLIPKQNESSSSSVFIREMLAEFVESTPVPVITPVLLNEFIKIYASQLRKDDSKLFMAMLRFALKVTKAMKNLPEDTNEVMTGFSAQYADQVHNYVAQFDSKRQQKNQ